MAFRSALKDPSQGEQRAQSLKKSSACVFKELDQKPGVWGDHRMGRWKALESGQKRQVVKVPVYGAKWL